MFDSVLNTPPIFTFQLIFTKSTIETLRKMHEICSKLTRKTPRRWCSMVFDGVLWCSIVGFDKVNVSWLSAKYASQFYKCRRLINLLLLCNCLTKNNKEMINKKQKTQVL